MLNHEISEFWSNFLIVFVLNRVQKSIALVFICGLLLLFLFPPWSQTHDGHPLVYNEHLGHHALWSPPSATGEDSWILKVSPSECKVIIDWYLLTVHCVIVVAIGAILCFAFRGSPTRTRLIYTSLFLAVCIPVPPIGDVPLLVWVVGGVLAPVSDTGHIDPFALLLLAISLLAVYAAVIFAILTALVWVANLRAHRSGSPN